MDYENDVDEGDNIQWIVLSESEEITNGRIPL